MRFTHFFGQHPIHFPLSGMLRTCNT